MQASVSFIASNDTVIVLFPPFDVSMSKNCKGISW